MIVDEIALNFPNDLVLDLPSPIARIEQLSISIESAPRCHVNLEGNHLRVEPIH
jgi:hypothetical protein